MAKVTVQKIERAPDVAIVLVLQWLAYALWGMFVASLMWLAGVVFASAIIESSRPASGDLLAFSLSATLVSLLLASLADYWYSRYEPALKVGVARVVMLVHVVLFTLAGVALAIAISYNLLSSLVGASGGSEERTAFVLTALVGVVALTVVTTRIIVPFKWAWLRKAAMVVLALLGIGFVVAALAGPAAESRLAAEDKVLQDGVEVIAYEINNYANNNDKLPASLSDVKIDTDNYSRSGERYDNAKKVIKDGSVKYTANTKPATDGGENYYNSIEPAFKDKSVSVAPYNPDGKKIFYYRLCVEYKTDNSARGGYSYPAPDYKEGMVMPNAYSHDKGEECYDLQTGYAY